MTFKNMNEYFVNTHFSIRFMYQNSIFNRFLSAASTLSNKSLKSELYLRQVYAISAEMGF